MINAVRIAADIVMALPQHRTPETTEGREGYLHPTNVSGNVSEAKLSFIVRDFTEEGLRDLEDTLRAAAAWAERKYPGAKATVEVKESYRNMKYVLDQHAHVTDYAEEAIRRAGLAPKRTSIRGGTDGARLSFMGVPTPNLFDGSMNFHGKKEYVPLEWMELAVETLLHLSDVWVERSGAVDVLISAVHGVGQAPSAVAGEPGGQQPAAVRTDRPARRARGARARTATTTTATRRWWRRSRRATACRATWW